MVRFRTCDGPGIPASSLVAGDNCFADAAAEIRRKPNAGWADHPLERAHSPVEFEMRKIY